MEIRVLDHVKDCKIDAPWTCPGCAQYYAVEEARKGMRTHFRKLLKDHYDCPTPTPLCKAEPGRSCLFRIVDKIKEPKP